MAYEAIVEEAKYLPENYQDEVLDFILFLKSKGTGESTASKPKRTLNTLAGKLIYMADDFDETPECFKEYM